MDRSCLCIIQTQAEKSKWTLMPSQRIWMEQQDMVVLAEITLAGFSGSVDLRATNFLWTLTRSSSEILLTSMGCRLFSLTSKSLRQALRWSFRLWHQMKKISQMSISLNLTKRHLTFMVLFILAMFTHLVVCQRFTKSISQGFTVSAQELYAISKKCFL